MIDVSRKSLYESDRKKARKNERKKTERRNVLLMYNPSSGQGNGRKDLSAIIEKLAGWGCEVTVFPVLPEKGLTSEKIIHRHQEGFDVYAIYGGDGSLNYVINGLMNDGLKVPVGYIPGGSTNDFARSFSDSISINDCCRAIAYGEPFAYDIGFFNEKRYFNYVAAFGAFTRTSYETPQEFKNIFGYGAYAMTAIGSFPDSISYRRHMKVTHDGITLEGNFIYGSISNSTSVGGMKLAYNQDASLNDGMFEVMLVVSPDNPLDLASVVGSLATGVSDDRFVKAFKTSKLTIETDEDIDWTLDGESGGTWRNVTIRVVPEAVSLMVTKKK